MCRWIYIQLAVAMYIVWVTPVRVVGAQHKLYGHSARLRWQLQSHQHTCHLSGDSSANQEWHLAARRPAVDITAMLMLVRGCLQGFNTPSEGMWFWLEGMVDLFFYVDLALNFFTAFEVRS